MERPYQIEAMQKMVNSAKAQSSQLPDWLNDVNNLLSYILKLEQDINEAEQRGYDKGLKAQIEEIMTR